MLRDYQQAALESVLQEIEAGKNPVISLPTGSGKSWVIAALCAEKRFQRVLVVTHCKELARQDDDRVIFANIQSLRVAELGTFSLLIIDEAPLIPKDESTMVVRLIESMSCPRVGITTAPYRLGFGFVHEDDDVKPSELVPKYLSPLVVKRGVARA